MLDLAEAQARLIALAPLMPVISAPIAPGHVRYLAGDLFARRTQPAADLSAMDGYAIAGPGPWRLIGEARAGAPFEGSLGTGECTRISTGAHMPRGAERVLIQENAATTGERIALAPGESLPQPMQHVRRRGFDFSEGETLLGAGSAIGPAQEALALAAGHDACAHREGPRVMVLESGDELAATASAARPSQIPASNGAMIARLIAPYASRIERPPPVADTAAALAEALAGAHDADVLITSGGASVGDHDLIRPALEAWGARIDFWKVAIKPGKPLLVATRDRAGSPRGAQVILGLPGNPVSSFVTAFLFALPLLRACLGAGECIARPILLEAGEDLPATGARREFMRAIREEGRVRLAGSQDSSALRALGLANALIERAPGEEAVKAGERVAVHNLQNG